MEAFFNFSIADFFDILVVSIILYTVIVWLKTTRAAFVARGMLVLAIVYLVARQLDLQLTAWIFQGFFAIFLIMVVVIFQEELRQIFERVAVWSLRPNSEPPLRSATTRIVVGAATDLAKERVGALVVIRGNDPLERHISGGIPLDGKLSEPLLKSIFDPHSAGHDGAVIVEQDQISLFAAHLPLSKDLRQLAHVGTRHCAALGLAELTDAFCIVVSEERGKISVARNGRLQELGNPQELVGLLGDFLRQKHPTERQSVMGHLARENWVAKMVALSLAIGFWYVFVPGSKIMEATYKVPVEIQNLAPGLEVESVQPPEIETTFSGPRRAFYLFNARKLRVMVDVSMVELGRRTFDLSERNIHHPADLKIEEIKPPALKISVRKMSRQDGNSKE